MCGRSSFVLSPEEVEALYSRVVATKRKRGRLRNNAGGSNADGEQQQQRQQHPATLAMPDRDSFRPSPNVAPTSSLPVLSLSSGAASEEAPSLLFSIETMKWGISTGSPSLPFVINARSETAPALARFARLLSSPFGGRGVVAADGYYEWEAKNKQPYFVRRSDGEPMLLAVLVEREGKEQRRGSGGSGGRESEEDQKQRPCFVILTRSPPKAMRWLHDRCPCILPTEEMAKEWLSLGAESDAAAAREASELLARAGAAVEASFEGEKEKEEPASSPPLLSWHPVTKEVGKTSYQRLDASRDIRLGGIASLFGKAKAAATVKKEEEKSPLPCPSPPRSGAKRKQEGGIAAAASNPKQRHQLQTPSKRAKPAVATTTTTQGKGQRSLDSFLSLKEEEEEKS